MPLSLDQLARKHQGVVMKVIDNRLLGVAEKILPGHGNSLYESYRLNNTENVSVLEILDTGIVD